MYLAWSHVDCTIDVSHLVVNFIIIGSRHGSILFLKGVLARKAQRICGSVSYFSAGYVRTLWTHETIHATRAETFDQTWSQDGWGLVRCFKNERGQHPAILTETSLEEIEDTEKNCAAKRTFFFRDKCGKSLPTHIAKQNKRFASSCLQV